MRIGIAVDVDTSFDGVEAVGSEEAALQGVVVARVEILQSGLGIIALVDMALAIDGDGAL